MLRHKKYRDETGLFLVQGEKAVRDTMALFRLEALVDDPDAIRKITTLANPPEVIAVYHIPETSATDLKTPSGSFSLVLDGVQDPGNLGTIIRTAHWFGLRKVYCSRDTVDIYNPKTVLATMGSLGHVEAVYCDLADLFDANPGLPVYGLMMEGEDIFDQKNPAPGLIVMGSEGHGPSASTAARVTTALTIPPADPAERPDSLNVAIAAAITLSQLLK